ncbi:MAG: HD domain-containing protein [Bacilli bacterium]|nr:HD domain-containing protein [Bacilli bacterium]
MVEEFKKYASNFDMNETSIQRKYYHSIRVKDISQLIAKYAGFNDEDAKIAEVVGLLHDYARFPQWRDYHTYNDLESIDHADLAVKLLFENGEIKKFWNKEEDYDEIYDAIKYHNKYEITADLSEHNKTLCKVIRDADKLDLFYLLGEGFIEEHEDAELISEKVKSDFENKKLISRIDVKNGNDLILLHLAFIFDLNYKYSFEYLHNRKLISRYFELIKDKGLFKPYFDMAERYIMERMDEDAR